MQIDENLIQGKIDIIERNLNFLDQYNEFSEKKFIRQYKDVQAVKYSLLEIIEACIDIASHIISIYKFQRPKTYSEIFSILGENKLINAEMSENLSEMARFRNLLVHSYAKVENKKVLKYIKEELDNIREFVKTILSLV